MVTREVQIRFTDIDMLGHVNNIIIQQYYDIGKMGYFVDVLGMPFIWKKEAFIVASINNSYFEEIKADEQIVIKTKVTKVGTKSISLLQEIVDLKTSSLKSRSESVMVAFDLEERKSFALYPHWREKIITHEGDCQY